MPNSNDKMVCRVCGLIQLDPPWGEDGKSPSYEICSCCGVEFGYEDSSVNGVVTYRRKWLEAGANWEDVEERPNNWSAEEQMKNVPLDFR